MSTKTAIVTGASSGIGLGIAKALLAEGYSVIANARKISTSEVLESSDSCFLVDGDVGLRATGASLTEIALQKTGRLDLVVNNAGIFVPGNFDEYTEEQYRSTMATNADGFFYVTQPAVRHMKTQGRGHVVTITATFVDQPIAGLNAFGMYFSKGALNAATTSLAIEYATTGIRFNAIAPGSIDTPMNQPASHEFLKNLHPIARLGKVDEIVPDLGATLVASTIHDDIAWAEWHWQGTHTSGSAVNMRGVVVTGLCNGIIAWARLYMEPVHDRSSTG